jgi:hypothetical protein
METHCFCHSIPSTYVVADPGARDVAGILADSGLPGLDNVPAPAIAYMPVDAGAIPFAIVILVMATYFPPANRCRFVHKVLTCVEYRAVSGVFKNIDLPPFSTLRVCPPPYQRRGVWGQYFGRRQT